jgi:hypothetical protein
MTDFSKVDVSAWMSEGEVTKPQKEAGVVDGFLNTIQKFMGASEQKPAMPPTPSSRGGTRSTWMQSSPYDVYGKKLFAKEGGLRYDLFTGERNPSQPLDKLTIGQVMALQKSRKDSAAGAYQFTLATLKDTTKASGLKETDMFDAKNQYRLFETFTRENEKHASAKLGVSRLNDAERYSMHFIGRYGGVAFLKTLRENPNANFAKAFPQAYARNIGLFKKIGGANATVRDVFGELAERMK